MRTSIAMAVLLVGAGALMRLVPHPPNFVALGALSLYAGARLPKRWAFVVPLAAMALSDWLLSRWTGRVADPVTRATIYATYAVIALLGGLVRRDAGPATRVGMSLGASTLFYLTSNLALWSTGWLYPVTPAGLLACYVAAIPFFGTTLLADLAGTAALFGLDAAARRVKLLQARRA